MIRTEQCCSADKELLMALKAFGAFDPARRQKAHAGQLRGSRRKRFAQAARHAVLKLEAFDRGVDPLTIIRERQAEVDRIVAAAAAKKYEKSSHWGGGW